MSPPLIAGLALAGMLLGWPIRAVIFRYAVPSGDPPRRSCPACGHPPAPAEPAGLERESRLLGIAGFSGRCRTCRARTGSPLLAVAVGTAVVFGALAARVHPGLVLAAACWLAACAAPLAFIDAAVHRLPDLLVVPAFAGTAVLLLAAAATGGSEPAVLAAATGSSWPVLLRAILGGFALAAFYLALLLVSPSAMGLGDVKLAASLGTLLAWFGWRTLIAGGFAGFALAGLYGVALLMTHRATRKQQIPFGPFMIAGAFLVILSGVQH